MKWFKHMSNSMDDLFVIELERRFGDAGYAFWWKTLELIAYHGKPGGTLVIGWSTYQEKMHKSRSTVVRLLDYCTTSGKLSYVDNGETVTITCLKFAEYADNYTKYDGVSSKRLQRHFKVSTKQEEEVEGEEDISVSQPVSQAFDPLPTFALLWQQYPRREGKKEALRHYRSSVKCEADVQRITRALSNYVSRLQRNKTEERFIQKGSTWFNNWEDWENVSPLQTVRPRATSPLLMSESEARRESHA